MSAGFTPATVSPTDNAKNAMPNDMAKRGWRTVAQIGSRIEACKRSSHEVRGWRAGAGAQRRWVSTPVVDARILGTRLAGGCTSVRPFSQLRPASASASSGPHARQPRAWAWKRSSPAPLRTPSRASVSNWSNSLHCIPLLVWSGITSPAYRYVVEGAQVPRAHDLFDFSQSPPEPSKRWQFLCNQNPVSLVESLPRAAREIVFLKPREWLPRPPGCARASLAAQIGHEFARSAAARLPGQRPARRASP